LRGCSSSPRKSSNFMKKNEIVHRGTIFNVERFTAEKEGKKVMHERIVGADTIGVIPLTAGRELILERQYRFAVSRYLYEIPAGHIDDGETAREAAERELREEIGYTASKLRYLTSAYVSPGIQTEKISYFLATGLRKSKTDMDKDEIIKPYRISLSEAMRMIKEGRIMDNTTISGLLYFSSFCKV
jgi:ADP-ribose pyrophosphatase